MKKLLVLSLAAIAVGANAAWQYDNSYSATHSHPFYYPWMASDPIADPVTLANTGPSNVFITDIVVLGAGYTGDIVFNVWNDTGGNPSGPTGDLVSETSNFTLASGFLWTITRLIPVTTMPTVDVFLGTTMTSHPGDNTMGPLIGLTPNVGSSLDYWGELNAGVWNYWTYNGNPLGNMAYGLVGVGTLFIETTEGSEIAGDINSVQLSDDVYYTAFPDEVSLSGTVHGTGDTLDPAPTQLDFTVEYNVGRPGLSYSARLRHVDTTYDQIMGGVAAIADETVTGSITSSAANYVDANGAYEFQIVFQPINEEDPAQDGWPLNLDVVDVASI